MKSARRGTFNEIKSKFNYVINGILRTYCISNNFGL